MYQKHTYTLLNYFYETARLGSYAKAAKHFGMMPQLLIGHLAEVEKQLGCPYNPQITKRHIISCKIPKCHNDT